MRKRKVHWTPRAALTYAACGADRFGIGEYAPHVLQMTRIVENVTCAACKRTTAFRIALEAEWNAEQWKAWGGK